MSHTENARKMPLRQRIAAVAVSALMVFTMCPAAQALADTASSTARSGDQQITTKNTDDNKTDGKGVIDDGTFMFKLYDGTTLVGETDGTSKKNFGSVDYGKTLTLKVFKGSTTKEVTNNFTIGKLETKKLGSQKVTVAVPDGSTWAYTGSITFEYTVADKKLSDSSIKVPVDDKTKVPISFSNSGYYAYTGSEIKPKLTVKDGTKTLTEGKDYTLDYDNNITGSSKTGAATVRAKGMGSYSGYTSKFTFHIVGLTYNSYGQGKWKGQKLQAQTAGKGSGTTKIGRMTAKAMNSALSGNVTYTMYNDSKSTSGKNGSAAGISGQAAQYMTMKLSGKLADRFDVYYRVYISGAGWMAWTKNGSKSGVLNYNSRMKMCGFQATLVAKGGKKPANGDYSTTYATKSNWDTFAREILYSHIKDKSSTTNYCISVDTTLCRVAIYKGSKGKWKLQKYWKCGVGIKSRPTTKGEFKLRSYKRARIDTGVQSYYYFHGYGGSLGFHSILHKLGSKSSYKTPPSKQLGLNVSHGCIRLALANAKYVYNMPNGTFVKTTGLV